MPPKQQPYGGVHVHALIERMNYMASSQRELRRSVEAMRADIAECGTAEEMAELRKAVANQAIIIARHDFIMRLCGATLIACIGLVGWVWNEGKNLYADVNRQERRTDMMEYKLEHKS